MNPGPAQVLTCPFCGQKKEILLLMSGNTFGATLWSDNKQEAPMLPTISDIQKCPKCGKYYFRSRQREKYEGFSWDTGTLTFLEMKEAFAQLTNEKPKLNHKEQVSLRWTLHHAYNDYYHRTDEKKTVAKSDHVLFCENALWLIDNFLRDNILKAEFYREIGEFEKAKAMIDSVQPNNDFVKSIAQQIRQRIDNKETEVFVIEH